MSEEESEVEQANVGEVQQSVPRVFWRTKEMNTRGPDIADDLLLPQVAEQTNLYSAQVRNLKSVSTDYIEMIRFTGLQILMGSLKYPQGRLYWSNDLCVPLIRNTMTRDRFFELRNHLHFVDNSARRDNTDKLWKIRPIITKVQEKCYTLPRSKHLSIDEQMIPFSGRCEYRQYVPSKPNPLGLKNFVLAARVGVVLDFEIYVGSNTLPPQDMADLGLGAGIVKLLCRTVDETCVLYTDRFFTSIKLADYLIQNKKDVYLTGTVMTNRIGPVSKKLTTDKQLKRGEWDEKVRNDEEVSVLKWKDTKAVTMLSTCIGGSPIGSCKRWCKVEKKKIDVAQPAVVKNYNTCMGGIDLCDRLIAYYRVQCVQEGGPCVHSVIS
ncbi:PiggyBac transposable element-derived protein 3 [Eumeta japonica]|uniref:PiggyBac transposable element-derived protein 3 n=1 Tax=Eumeta variegata TaxID=151549 RepID=A0A4C1USU3_EUMVA|nr:PiggyBac transposable element-derived protein 3 [Eumeta japonica]